MKPVKRKQGVFIFFHQALVYLPIACATIMQLSRVDDYESLFLLSISSVAANLMRHGIDPRDLAVRNLVVLATHSLFQLLTS